ncbi:uncharacterized protein LOC115625366 [Scaptodrosophila lebanonensis]|uniref:Uncharacterized protein LOC115625366 n=1 Tax=Drosophila lebanonensis TaxID=7225 RepID=A0A6J2TMA3_DROLE|nr:uncharacterized protein LOC115625366 [Scaptodrosophila lebanonensis]
MDTIQMLISFFILAVAHANTGNVTVTTSETTEYGPVTIVLDNLAQIAVNVSDETSTQLQAKLERTAQDLTGNIEVITATGMQQLSDALHATNELFLANPNCNSDWNLDEFTANVTEQLTACTVNLTTAITSFSSEGKQIVNNVQTYVQQIAELPSFCHLISSETVDLSFAGGTNCFMRRITEINQNMSLALHEASLLLVGTRQRGLKQVEQAEDCTNKLVAQINEFLSNERANCA